MGGKKKNTANKDSSVQDQIPTTQQEDLDSANLNTDASITSQVLAQNEGKIHGLRKRVPYVSLGLQEEEVKLHHDESKPESLKHDPLAQSLPAQQIKPSQNSIAHAAKEEEEEKTMAKQTKAIHPLNGETGS